MKTKGNPSESVDPDGFMNLDSNLDIFDISQITSRFLKDATRRSSVCPIQHFDPVVSHQRLHHLFGAGVESQQALTLGNALPDQLRIDALQVCQNDQLLEACFITDIAWAVRVCLPPFLCSNTEQGHIQSVCLAGTGKALTPPGYIPMRKCPTFSPSVGEDPNRAWSPRFFGDVVNTLDPACTLNLSNSTGLRQRLLSCAF